MNRVERFMDTGYWLALAVRSNQLHERAVRLSGSIRGLLVTSDAVLLELGDALARVPMRRYAVTLLTDIRTAPETEVVPLSPQLFARALELYAARPDKEWGLTDCVSFVVMRDRGIREALSADRHFVQAGFRALLRE